MPDFVTPDGRRVTLLRDTGHQIRLVIRRSRIHVTCRCQEGKALFWALPAEGSDEDMWRTYNTRIPHDPAAGVFIPIDETTGEPLAAAEAPPAARDAT